MKSERLRLIPLGGLGEIGMNCFILEWGDSRVMIDCGIQFPDARYSGVELLAPDLSYLFKENKKLLGVVITHGHEDHIGGIPFLARHQEVDVYCTPFPKGLLKNKLEEFHKLHEIRFHDLENNKSFKLGPFTFHPIRVQHSIIESMAFAIETPVGNIIHTGDFKHDPNEMGGEIISFAPFEEWGKKGVQILLSDSTNAERAGHTISELEITNSFDKFFSGQTGRLIIAMFASNIRRIEHLLKLAHQHGKKVAFAGRSMHSYTRLAQSQNSLEIPEDTLILLENLERYPDNKVIIFATGSQAEPGAALVRIAEGSHKEIKIKSNDLVILSSRMIPGNERNIASMIDELYRSGAEVLYESIHQVHVSGHGFQDELLLMLKATQPKFFVPIHGEYRHLKKHANLAKKAGVKPENTFVIENGQVLEMSATAVKETENLNLQKIAIVGGEYLEATDEAFSQRSSLAKTGIVFAALIRNKKSKKLVTDPVIAPYGLIYKEGERAEEVQEEALDKIEDVYEDASQKSNLEELVRIEMRRFYKKRASHKPVVIPLILDI